MRESDIVLAVKHKLTIFSPILSACLISLNLSVGVIHLHFTTARKKCSSSLNADEKISDNIVKVDLLSSYTSDILNVWPNTDNSEFCD